jgi:hypothetical protein
MEPSSPSPKIDHMWHQHMLRHQLYMHMCAVVRCYVWRWPNAGTLSKIAHESAKAKLERIASTGNYMRFLFSSLLLLRENGTEYL